jgi:hypothetical protein
MKLKKFISIKKLKNNDVCAGNRDLFEHGKLKKCNFLMTFTLFLFWLPPAGFLGFYMIGYHPEHHHIGPRHDNNKNQSMQNQGSILGTTPGEDLEKSIQNN